MNIFRKILKLFVNSKKVKKNIIIRSKHIISRKNISKNVLKVLYKLKQHGYKAYIVGGGVRDLLLQKQPKDFDVVTDARPEKIRKLFKNCYIIGRRFPLVHVKFWHEIVEVVTFRGPNRKKHRSKEGMILRDNIYGNIEEDAVRRDFTINALYYNIYDYSVIDYTNGIHDLEQRQLRLIGDPSTRYKEDPVRMLRAIRFAAKLDFNIHQDTSTPIKELKSLLFNVPTARLYDEYLKLFYYGHAKESFRLLQKYELLAILFPNYKHYKKNYNFDFIVNALTELDEGIANKNQISPAWGFAILLWPGVKVNLHRIEFLDYKHKIEKLLSEQREVVSISRKLSVIIKDIWITQLTLIKLISKPEARLKNFSSSHKFKLGYKFLLLRATAGDDKAQSVIKAWSKYVI